MYYAKLVNSCETLSYANCDTIVIVHAFNCYVWYCLDAGELLSMTLINVWNTKQNPAFWVLVLPTDLKGKAYVYWINDLRKYVTDVKNHWPKAGVCVCHCLNTSGLFY